MHIAHKTPLYRDKIESNQINAKFINHRHSKYQSVGDKIDAFLQNKKAESSPDMIEIFYFHLFPVTYRNWVSQ